MVRPYVADGPRIRTAELQCILQCKDVRMSEASPAKFGCSNQGTIRPLRSDPAPCFFLNYVNFWNKIENHL